MLLVRTPVMTRSNPHRSVALKILGKFPLLLWLAPSLAATVLLASSPSTGAPAGLVTDKGDTAWMMVSTLLVLLMLFPGLAMFYGGLVRTKNMLSVLSQVLGVAAVAVLVWIGWGYSVAFAPGNAVVGGFGKVLLNGVGPASLVPTFTAGVGIPELVFAAFQMTFAAIAVALITGAKTGLTRRTFPARREEQQREETMNRE